MIKAMKKLKFWSRKKRKKKNYNYVPSYPPPPPPPSRPPPHPPLPQINHYFCCSCSCSPAEPSAPPLPPSWFTSKEEACDTLLATEVVQPAAPEFERLAMPDVESSSTSSYQQYMVPNPVYGIPVPARTAKTERTGRLFGCVLDFGIHLIQCFIPCYRVKEVE